MYSIFLPNNFPQKLEDSFMYYQMGDNPVVFFVNVLVKSQ